MKNFLILLCMLSSFPAFAKNEDKIKTLLQLKHLDKQINTIFDQAIFNQVRCSFIIPNTELVNVKKELWTTLNVNELTNPILQFFQNSYTEQELDELIHFYQTPLGQKTITLTEKLASMLIPIQQQWIEKNLPNVMTYGKKLEQKYPQRSGNEIQSCIQQNQK